MTVSAKEKNKALTWFVYEALYTGKYYVKKDKFKTHHKCLKELKRNGLIVVDGTCIWLTGLGWQIALEQVATSYIDLACCVLGSTVQD